MWRSTCLEGFLADMDSLERRPAYRAAPPADPGSRFRQATHSLARTRLDEDPATDRRRTPRRWDPVSAKAQTATDAAGAMLDQLDLAVVILHPSGYLQLANAAARRIAARGDCLRIRARRVQLIDRQAQVALEEFLHAGATAGARAAESRCLCRRSNGPVRYVIQAEWLATTAPAAQSLASLLIHEPYRVGRVSAELLVRLYNMTPMESQLAAALYIAPKLDAAAARCGISRNTAKTHLKHVFSKCAVGSQAELMRLLALGPRTR